MSEPTQPTTPRLVRNPPSIEFGVNQHEFKWWRRITWGGIVTVATACGFVGNCGLTRFDASNTAMAQTAAKADQAIDRTKVLELRVEAVDSGTGSKIERLERKIDANNEQAQKERAEDRALLQTVLREVKKK